MKNGVICILLVLLALVWAGRDRDPRAAIEDTTKAETHNADYQRCIRVDPGPLKPPPQRLNVRGHVSEIA